MRRKILVCLWISLLFCTISFLFWQNEIKYTLPTPIPQNFHQIAIGNKVDLKCCLTDNRPVFIHFFNPDCPCSRFNIPHVSGLIKKYEDRINFKIVVLNNKKKFTIEEIQKKFDAKIPVYFDESIAENCGVFSTPQAVIVDPSHNLYYRGNYNKTRYCTNADSNYAQMALESLLKKTKIPSFDALALRAYGCSLPECSK
jgi:hypothetical protein